MSRALFTACVWVQGLDSVESNQLEHDHIQVLNCILILGSLLISHVAWTWLRALRSLNRNLTPKQSGLL